MTDEKGDSHTTARYIIVSGTHVVQCTCGEKFKGSDQKAVMGQHFRHAWAKVNERHG